MKEGKLMEALPDDIWIQILEIGIHKKILYCSDLSSLSISCKRFDKLSNDDTLWSSLVTLNFPLPQKYDVTSFSSSCSNKTLFKHRFKRSLERELASVNRDIYKDKHRLSRLTKRIKRLQREIVVMIEQMKELSGEILDIIKDSPIKHRENIEWLNAEMIKMDEQILKFSGDSTGINKESSQAPPCASATPTSAPSASAPTLSTHASFSTFFELPVHLKTKTDHIASLQQGILSTQEQHEHDIDTLHRHQQEHDELLAVLTYRLVLLDASSQPNEVDEDEDLDCAESAKDDDDTEVTEDDDDDDDDEDDADFAHYYDTDSTEDDDYAEDFQ